MIKHVPAFYGARHSAGHTAAVFHPGGGEFANVASDWHKWILMGGKSVAAMFVGKNCSLRTNPNWDVSDPKGSPNKEPSGSVSLNWVTSSNLTSGEFHKFHFYE